MTTCRAHAMRCWLRVGAVTVLLVPPAMAQTAAPDADDAVAGPAPRWEAGVAAAIGSVPDYPGAAQNHTRGLVSPFVIYRGRVLRVDREGIRGRLFGSPDLEVDLSASDPLLKDTGTASVGAGLVWTPWQSAARSP